MKLPVALAAGAFLCIVAILAWPDRVPVDGPVAGQAPLESERRGEDRFGNTESPLGKTGGVDLGRLSELITDVQLRLVRGEVGASDLLVLFVEVLELHSAQTTRTSPGGGWLTYELAQVEDWGSITLSIGPLKGARQAILNVQSKPLPFLDSAIETESTRFQMYVGLDPEAGGITFCAASMETRVHVTGGLYERIEDHGPLTTGATYEVHQGATKWGRVVLEATSLYGQRGARYSMQDARMGVGVDLTALPESPHLSSVLASISGE
jgi:hypothetical protein